MLPSHANALKFSCSVGPKSVARSAAKLCRRRPGDLNYRFDFRDAAGQRPSGAVSGRKRGATAPLERGLCLPRMQRPVWPLRSHYQADHGRKARLRSCERKHAPNGTLDFDSVDRCFAAMTAARFVALFAAVVMFAPGLHPHGTAKRVPISTQSDGTSAIGRCRVPFACRHYLYALHCRLPCWRIHPCVFLHGCYPPGPRERTRQRRSASHGRHSA
jgi:hypothetical protein